MSKKANYSYIGIAFVILVFGIIFIPDIIDRISNNDVIRKESRSDYNTKVKSTSDLAYVEIDGKARKVPSFSFTNQDGEIITNEDYLGKVYLVEFFFTSCPSICPKMKRNLVQIQNSFEGFENFGVASFTINPEHDTPEVLKTYANQYGITNPNWHLLTGEKEAIYKLSNEGFYIYAGENANVAGGFEHSGNFALIDKEGYVRSRKDKDGNPIIYYRGIISQEEKMDKDGVEEQITALKEDIKKLLNE